MHHREVHLVKEEQTKRYRRIPGEAVARIGRATLYHDPETGGMQVAVRSREGIAEHTVDTIADAADLHRRHGPELAKALEAVSRDEHAVQRTMRSWAREWRGYASRSTDATHAMALEVAAGIAEQGKTWNEVGEAVRKHELATGPLAATPPCPGIYAVAAAMDHRVVVQGLDESAEVGEQTRARALAIAIEAGARRTCEYLIARARPETLEGKAPGVDPEGHAMTPAERIARQTCPHPGGVARLADRGIDVAKAFGHGEEARRARTLAPRSTIAIAIEAGQSRRHPERVARAMSPSEHAALAATPGRRERGSREHWNGKEVRLDPDRARTLARRSAIAMRSGLEHADARELEAGMRDAAEIVAACEGVALADPKLDMHDIAEGLQEALQEAWAERSMEGREASRSLRHAAAVAQEMASAGGGRGASPVVRMRAVAQGLLGCAGHHGLELDRLTSRVLIGLVRSPGQRTPEVDLYYSVGSLDQAAEHWRKGGAASWQGLVEIVGQAATEAVEETRQWKDTTPGVPSTTVAGALQDRAAYLREEHMNRRAQALVDECDERARCAQAGTKHLADPESAPMVEAIARRSGWQAAGEAIRNALNERIAVLGEACEAVRSEPGREAVAELGEDDTLEQRTRKVLGGMLAEEFGAVPGIGARPRAEVQEWLRMRIANEERSRDLVMTREAEEAIGTQDEKSPAARWARAPGHRTTPRGAARPGAER